MHLSKKNKKSNFPQYNKIIYKTPFFIIIPLFHKLEPLFLSSAYNVSCKRGGNKGVSYYKTNLKYKSQISLQNCESLYL